MDEEITFAAVIIAAGRLILNDQPCTLATIALKAAVAEDVVDSVWRRLVKNYIRECGNELGLINAREFH